MPDWPHAPPHKLFEPGTYMVTGATLHKKHFFHNSERLTLLQNHLLSTLKEFGWQIQAWAIFVNHYHFIAYCNASPETLCECLNKIHSNSTREINQKDKTPGRKVWYQYWDKHITYNKSYFPRLKYVHQNPVHHQKALQAEDYEWCSAGWLAAKADPAYRKTINSFRIDRLKIYDDF